MTTNNKLQLTISPAEQIPIKDLTTSLDGLSTLFSSFAHHNNFHIDSETDPLVIKKAETGSLILHLEAIGLTTIDLLHSANIIIDFLKNMQLMGDFFKEKFTNLRTGITREEAKAFRDLATLAANNPGSKIVFAPVTISGDNNTVTHTTSDAKQFQDNINSFLNEEPPNKTIQMPKCLFNWANKDCLSETSKANKGIIKQISNKRTPVQFNDDKAQHYMTTSHNEYKSDWHRLTYIVDVEVVLNEQGQPRLYTILKCYPTSTIDENTELQNELFEETEV